MLIKNTTKKIIITSDAKFCSSLWDQLLGLLNPRNPRTLVFKTRFGIHTLFLKEPIDVLILDNQNRVVKIKKNLSPNQLFFWNPKYKLVVELLSGTLEKSQTKLMDLIEIR